MFFQDLLAGSLDTIYIVTPGNTGKPIADFFIHSAFRSFDNRPNLPQRVIKIKRNGSNRAHWFNSAARLQEPGQIRSILEPDPGPG